MVEFDSADSGNFHEKVPVRHMGQGKARSQMKRKKSERAAAEPQYRANRRERAVIEKHLRRMAEAAPRLKVVETADKTNISTDHPDEVIGQALLTDALGTSDSDFYGGLIRQLANATSANGRLDERNLNFMLAVIKDVKPRDQVEAMLAAQMAATHMAILGFAPRLGRVETVPQLDSITRAFNQLERTFTAQMEALRRYRTGGEQKVTVQHVSVSEGGQAIVGNVTHTAREPAPDSATHAPPSLSRSKELPMSIISEPERGAVPVERGQKTPSRRSRENDDPSST
jgi:hypothetical protein